VETQTNNYKGLVQNFHIRHRLCTHNRTCNPDYVSNNLQLSVVEGGLNSFIKEAGKKLSKKFGRELVLGLTSHHDLDYLQIFVDYINL
jgi:hypothetical protein